MATADIAYLVARSFGAMITYARLNEMVNAVNTPERGRVMQVRRIAHLFAKDRQYPSVKPGSPLQYMFDSTMIKNGIGTTAKVFQEGGLLGQLYVEGTSLPGIVLRKRADLRPSGHSHRRS